MVNYAIINGHQFDCYGVSNRDDELVLLIRAHETTADDIRNAIEEGEEPIRIYDSAGSLQYEFTGFTEVSKFLIEYQHKFSPTLIDIAINVSIEKEKVMPNDITDLQLALAELAAMIGGNANG